jgi:dienelactone hydrolase
MLAVLAGCGSAKPHGHAKAPVDAGGLVAIDAGAAARDAASRDPRVEDAAASAVALDAGPVTPLERDAGPALVRDAGTRDAGGGAPVRSSGCGKAATGTSSFQMRTLRVGERDRVYFVRVPSSYDRNRAYPLYFGFHNSGGNGSTGGVDLAEFVGDGAIVVSPTAIEPNRTFPEQLPAELALFDALRERMGNDFCIDRDHVYSVGISAGAEMTNFLACKRGDLLRATGALSGRISPGNLDDMTNDCQPIPPTFLYHAVDDDVAVVADSRTLVAARVKALGCAGEDVFDKAGDCRAYRGCSERLTYCEPATGGHGGGLTREYRERMYKFLNAR